MNDENELIQQLRAQGHRLTPQRRLVLEVLQQTTHHISADEIAQHLTRHYPSIVIDHATIYRTLKWLRDNHLISETGLGDKHMVYALLTHHHHHHLVCERCQQVIEVDPALFESVREALLQHYNFQAHLHHLAVFGLCEQCRLSTHHLP